MSSRCLQRLSCTASLEFMSSFKEPQSAPHTVQDENQIIAERRAKLAELRKRGVTFPNDFRRDQLTAELHQAWGEKSSEEIEPKAVKATVAGRMMLKRVMGKASFATLQDMSGRIQLYVARDGVGEATYEAFKHYDLGDIVGARGTLFKTKTGELSVKVAELRLLAKALRPLPEKFHGLADQESKYRQRYVDLIMNEETRAVFQTRSRVVQAIREFMAGKGFLEVETPMMQPIPGGANARPFKTHHNALDMELFLRVAPELYLKRLVVGGFEKVFEINRNFRNEGISTRHNPEFTMLEFYEAYRDYRHLMGFTQELLCDVARKVLGSLQLRYGGHAVDLAGPFEQLSVLQAIRKFHPETGERELGSREALIAALKGTASSRTRTPASVRCSSPCSRRSPSSGSSSRPSSWTTPPKCRPSHGAATEIAKSSSASSSTSPGARSPTDSPS